MQHIYRIYDEMTATMTRAVIAAIIGVCLLIAGIASFMGPLTG
jgi:hypothetical protein